MKWKTRGIHRLWDDRGKELRQKSLPTVSPRTSCDIDGTASDAVNTKPTDTVYHQGQNNKPLLGEADWNNSAWRRSIWIMSFDDTLASRPTGLLVDVSTANSRSQGYVYLPDDDYANGNDKWLSGTHHQ